MKVAFCTVGLGMMLACDGVEGNAGAPDETEAATLNLVSSAHRPHRPPRDGRFLDVNNDGFADVAIGAPSERATFVYFGSATGIPTSPSSVLTGDFEAGAAVAPAGDVNGDGFSDLVVGSGIDTTTVYLGAAAGFSPTGIPLQRADALRFGATVSTAGDVNGDHFDDVIVGTRFGALVYLGNAGGIDPTAAFLLAGPGSAALTVVGGTDFDRDGFGDVVVGSGNIGVAVYMGSASGFTSAPQLTLAGSGGAAAAGDVDGDGYPDLLVATSDDGVHVYLGGRGGLRAARFFTLRNPAGGAGFGDPIGGAMSTAGDVDRDGFDDVVIGTIFDDRAYLFLGGKKGLGPRPFRTWTGAAGSGFGAAVGGVGDTNGDGFDDVVIGARTAGQAFVFLGRASGPRVPPSLTLTGPARFGEAIGKMTR